MHQGETESLRDYIGLFNKEAVTTPNLQQEIAVLALMSGLQDGTFKSYLGKKSFTTLGAVLGKINDYMKGEELTNASTNKHKAETSYPGERDKKNSREEKKDYSRDLSDKKDDPW